MSVWVELVEGPLGPLGPAGPADAEAGAGSFGAVVTFDGVVRGLEGGRPLEALRYEAYEPMTTAELRKLGAEVRAEYGLHALSVWHSAGRVPVGAVSFRLAAVGTHRAETLAATGSFIERMKRDVPLWKVPVWHSASGGTREGREATPPGGTPGCARGGVGSP